MGKDYDSHIIYHIYIIARKPIFNRQKYVVNWNVLTLLLVLGEASTESTGGDTAVKPTVSKGMYNINFSYIWYFVFLVVMCLNIVPVLP